MSNFFSFFLQFARVYRAIDGNYTRNSIFCQRFFAKKVSKKYDTNSEAFCSEYLGPNGPSARDAPRAIDI